MNFFKRIIRGVNNSNELLNDSLNVNQTNRENMTDGQLTVSYGTGWPIDVVYGNLHKSYEQKGFEDAMNNSNSVFCDMSIELITKNILMVFREVELSYDAKKQELSTKKRNCELAGLLTTVSDIEDNLRIVENHKNELKELYDDFVANSEESIPVKSYKYGFLRGVGTVSLTNPSSVSVLEK